MLLLLAELAFAQEGLIGPSVPPELYPTVSGPAVPTELLEPEAPEVSEAAAQGAAPAAFELNAATESELLQRFAEEAPQSGAEAGASAFSLADKSWLWVLGLGALGAVWLGREKLMGKVKGGATKAEEPLRVLARQGVGHQAGVILLEASTGDGGTRRLLVGVSGHGPPTLVADLGGEIPGFEELVRADVKAELAQEPTHTVTIEEEPEADLAEELERTARLAASLPPPPAIELPEQTAEDSAWRPRPKKALTGRFTDEDLAPLEDEPSPAANKAGPAPEERDGLIRDILEGRGAKIRAWI